MRFVVYGAGAIGGVIGARLHQHGHETLLIARGAHYDAIRERGLRLEAPEGTFELAIPVRPHPRAVDWRLDDVVVLAMKSQDTASALDALGGEAPPGTAVVCAQNGVDNERQALRRFAEVYGMCVMCPASHLEPGVVEANGAPLSGLLDIGLYPAGLGPRSGEIAGALESSLFGSRALGDVMRWKYRKLLMNLGNSVDALFGAAGREGGVAEAARREGEACLRAAGIEFASEDEDDERRGDLVRLRPVAGRRRQGGSTWQSLERGLSTVETDYLNGEIVLLGRLNGVPTPVNEALQALTSEAARAGVAPRTSDPSALIELASAARVSGGESGG